MKEASNSGDRSWSRERLSLQTSSTYLGYAVIILFNDWISQKVSADLLHLPLGRALTLRRKFDLKVFAGPHPFSLNNSFICDKDTKTRSVDKI